MSDIRDEIAELLSDDYACTRAWEAWQYGTMTQDDFVPLADTVRVDELAHLIENGNTEEVTRLEVIDHTPCVNCKGKRWLTEGEKPVECPECNGMGSAGRSIIFWDETKQIRLSLQDQGRTLKILISKREPNG